MGLLLSLSCLLELLKAKKKRERERERERETHTHTHTLSLSLSQRPFLLLFTNSNLIRPMKKKICIFY
jgi:hypothetical protein